MKMLRILFNRFSFPLLGAMLFTACASTQLTAVWKDSAHAGHPAKVMVIGVAKNPLNRRLFEDEFVLQLKSHGVDGVASYTVLTDKLQDDQEAIEAKVKELGTDSVLITRLVSKKTVQSYVPGFAYYPPSYYGTWPDYYGYGYRYLYSPGYIATDEYAVIETNLYETETDNLVWAASSETLMTESNQSMIKAYINIMVNSMVEHGLLDK